MEGPLPNWFNVLIRDGACILLGLLCVLSLASGRRP